MANNTTAADTTNHRGVLLIDGLHGRLEDETDGWKLTETMVGSFPVSKKRNTFCSKQLRVTLVENILCTRFANE